MKRFAAIAMFTLCLALAAPPAFCQDYGSYYNSGYQMQGQVPGMMNPNDYNCAAQPANQYYNPMGQDQQFAPVQQQQYDPMQQQQQFGQPQFNQMVTPTQVPYQQNNQNYQQYNNNAMSPYQQQEQALEQSQMAQQMEEVKQRKEVDDSYHVTSEFNDHSGGAAINDSNRGPGKTKAATKAVAGGVGKLMKGSMRYVGPAAGTVGSFFLLRAAFGGGNGMMVMPMGGGMMMMP